MIKTYLAITVLLLKLSNAAAQLFKTQYVSNESLEYEELS